MATPISLIKNKFEIESPKSGDMDPESCRIFERDHQMSFEKEILSVIECKDPEMESIESRWYRLHDKVTMSANGTWKHDPKMVPPLQQCAADLFARMYFREFNEHPKNKKYMKQGPKAILAQMKAELSSLKVWSCVYKGLEWRVYDKFGDPEEASTPTATQPVDMELINRTLNFLNVPWKLPGAVVSHSTPGGVQNSALPNISHSLPILPHNSSLPIIQKVEAPGHQSLEPNLRETMPEGTDPAGIRPRGGEEPHNSTQNPNSTASTSRNSCTAYSSNNSCPRFTSSRDSSPSTDPNRVSQPKCRQIGYYT